MMDLLIDVGNSRIKWAFSQAGKLSAHGAAEHCGIVPAEAIQAWLAGAPPANVVAANVAGDVCAQLLDDWVQRQWSLAVTYVEVDPNYSDLKLAYSDSGQFGVDRWLALIAARAMLLADVAVIDVGTAVTMDVLSAQGQHLGGVIMPGLSLMRHSLQARTSAIQPELESREDSRVALLGCDTATGIANGSLYAIAGGLEHSIARHEAQTGRLLSVIISGGDAEAIQAELKIETQHIPDLVLRGIQILKGVGE